VAPVARRQSFAIRPIAQNGRRIVAIFGEIISDLTLVPVTTIGRFE